MSRGLGMIEAIENNRLTNQKTVGKKKRVPQRPSEVHYNSIILEYESQRPTLGRCKTAIRFLTSCNVGFVYNNYYCIMFMVPPRYGEHFPRVES